MKIHGTEDSSTKLQKVQAGKYVRRPQMVFRALTAIEAIARFPGLYYERLYRLADEGELHPIVVHRRILYPEWELERIFANANSGLAGAAISDGGQNGAISASAKIEDGSKVGKVSSPQFRRRVFFKAA